LIFSLYIAVFRRKPLWREFIEKYFR